MSGPRDTYQHCLDPILTIDLWRPNSDFVARRKLLTSRYPTKNNQCRLLARHLEVTEVTITLNFHGVQKRFGCIFCIV